MNSRETFYQRLRDELKSVEEQGLFKRERIIAAAPALPTVVTLPFRGLGQSAPKL